MMTIRNLVVKAVISNENSTPAVRNAKMWKIMRATFKDKRGHQPVKVKDAVSALELDWGSMRSFMAVHGYDYREAETLESLGPLIDAVVRWNSSEFLQIDGQVRKAYNKHRRRLERSSSAQKSGSKGPRRRPLSRGPR